MPRLALLLFLLVTPAAAQRPNIVFILADDLGYSDLGAYGNPFNETPRIDSLARMGMRFTQAYVASPVCSPSRAAIMTGRHPARLHLTNFLVGLRTDTTSNLDPAPFQHYLAPGETTLAEMLRDQGYNTGIVGKWHLGGADSVSAHTQGFDNDRIIAKNGLDYYNYSISSRGETVFEDDGTHYITDKLTDYAVEFIEQQSADTPFFLYVPYSAPHVLIVPRGDKLRPYLFKYNQFGGRYNPYYAAFSKASTMASAVLWTRWSRKGWMRIHSSYSQATTAGSELTNSVPRRPLTIRSAPGKDSSMRAARVSLSSSDGPAVFPPA
jgi:arylsulfatase A